MACNQSESTLGDPRRWGGPFPERRKLMAGSRTLLRTTSPPRAWLIGRHRTIFAAARPGRCATDA